MLRKTPKQVERIAITQPYVPAYRYPLWDHVIKATEAAGFPTRVFFGGDKRQLALRAQRADGVRADWAHQVPTRTWGIGTKLPRLLHRSIPRRWRQKSIVLTEMQANNLLAWTAVFSRRPYITFGHGKSGTASDNGLSVMLENFLNRHASHVLTYSEAGRRDVISRTGLPPERVTSFNNSTDTAALQNEMSQVDDQQIERFRALNQIPANAKIALFIGALNEHKRLDLLVEAADLVFEADSTAWLVIAGDGKDRSILEEFSTKSGRVTMLGQSDSKLIALAGSASSLIVNPGRVGLVAVDALVLKLPLLSSSGAQLAPEADYLTLGENLFVAEPTASDFAQAWMQVSEKNVSEAKVPSIEEAASRISQALLSTISNINRSVS